MAIHLYLSLFPEALIASMLSPEDFGTYYALGSAKKSRGQAIFLKLTLTIVIRILRSMRRTNAVFPTMTAA